MNLKMCSIYGQGQQENVPFNPVTYFDGCETSQSSGDISPALKAVTDNRMKVDMHNLCPYDNIY
jgi:hypothetical protein